MYGRIACLFGAGVVLMWSGVLSDVDGGHMFGECYCAKTSGNKGSCCASQNGAGMGTGTFCGSWFSEHHCGGSTPVCCTSFGESGCYPNGSSCSSGCNGGGGGGRGFGGCDALLPPPPSQASEEYDHVRASAFAQLAKVAGCGANNVSLLAGYRCKECAPAGFEVGQGTKTTIRKDSAFLIEGNVFAYVAPLKNLRDGSLSGCVVGQPGTQKPVQVIRNLEATLTLPESWKKACPDCGVHSGTLAIWERLRDGADGVFANLRSLGCGPQSGVPVYVTGHSLGAALSVLTSFDLQLHNYTVAQSYVFEPPRFCNEAFAEIFKNSVFFERSIPIFQVTNARDPNPGFPPFQLGYRRVGAEAYYGLSWEVSYVVCEGNEDKECINRYSLAERSLHGNDHCDLKLLPGGICGSCEDEAEASLLQDVRHSTRSTLV